MIHQRKMPAFKVGGQWRIPEGRFRKWVEHKEKLIYELE
jgi:excisionase family DNA binding protein